MSFVTEGLTWFLNEITDPIYIGLIGATGYDSDVGLSASDTMASHAGWQELTAYGEATRPQWNYGTAANKLLTNANAASFTINATSTIKGFFLTTDSTKGGTSGTLLLHRLFTAGDQSFSADETLDLTGILKGAGG